MKQVDYFQLAICLARAEALLTLAPKRPKICQPYVDPDEEPYSDREEQMLDIRTEAQAVNRGY